MFENAQRLWQALGEPEFLSLVLEPLLFYGPLLAVIVFLFSWIAGEPKSQKLALILMVVSGLANIPFRESAHASAERVLALSGVELLQPHLALVDSTQWPFLATAAVATLALFAGRNGKTGLWLTIIALVAALTVSMLGLWLFLKGAEIFRPSLRSAGKLPVEAVSQPGASSQPLPAPGEPHAR